MSLRLAQRAHRAARPATLACSYKVGQDPANEPAFSVRHGSRSCDGEWVDGKWSGVGSPNWRWIEHEDQDWNLCEENWKSGGWGHQNDGTNQGSPYLRVRRTRGPWQGLPSAFSGSGPLALIDSPLLSHAPADPQPERAHR